MSRRLYRASAIMFGLPALPPAYYAVMLPWAPRLDFDIIGFRWMVQNIAELFASAMAIAFAYGAVVAALRARWDV